MASNIDVTLKRYNGTDYDLILPTTHLGQIYTDNTLTTSLNTYLDDTFINVDQIGAANGLATLDANQKLTLSQLPDVSLDSLLFGGVVAANGTDQEIVDKIHQAIYQAKTIYNSNNQMQRSSVGVYLTVATGGEINQISTAIEGTYLGYEQDAPPKYYKVFFEQKDGGSVLSTTSSGVLEVGDWLVITNASGEGTQVNPIILTFAPINNAYEVATTTSDGIVKLSDATTVTGMTGNDVITEGVLAGLIGTEAGDIAAGDHLHDDRYYTETEVQNFFSGATAITGYSKSNWDTAYGWGDHSQEGYLTEESLADLTDVSLTSATEHDILRYNGTNWVNDATFKPILYGANPTGTIPGTILIVTD